MTDAELDAIRAAWRWAKPDHSVSRLLTYIDGLRASRPITITDRAEWERIVENTKPQWLVVSGGFEWFRGGTSVVYRWAGGAAR